MTDSIRPHDDTGMSTPLHIPGLVTKFHRPPTLALRHGLAAALLAVLGVGTASEVEDPDKQARPPYTLSE